MQPMYQPNSSVTILVVDDNVNIRRAAARILAGQGYKVIEAASGPEGVVQFEKHLNDVSVIVTDTVMPRMSGVDMVRRIMSSALSVKVVFMANYDDAELCEIDPREYAILQKPFMPEAMIKTVRECLTGNVAMRSIFGSV